MENVTGEAFNVDTTEPPPCRELRLKLLSDSRIHLQISSGGEIVVDAVELIHALAKECICVHRHGEA